METRMLIGGEHVTGAGAPLSVQNPFTEDEVASVALPSEEQLDAAVAAAHEAFPGWAAMPAVERAEVLHEVAARMRAKTDELGELMTREGGKPLVENTDEVGWVAAAFDYYAEMGRNFAGRVIPPIEASQLALVLKEPIGVVAAIVPWNYPLLLLAWKLAPPLAAGNPVVAKPSELTPLSTLALAPVFDALPPGVVNLVPGAGEVGERLPYGLGANVNTKDLDAIMRCMRELKAGTVWFNDPLTDNDAGPFGGFKQSGLGRELGQEGLEAFQETKHVHLETVLGVKEWWYPYGSGSS